MPQIQFETYPSQIFWLSFFFSLVVLTSIYLLPYTTFSLFERRRILEERLSETKKNDQEAELILKEVGNHIDLIRSRADDLLLKTERECLAVFHQEKQNLTRELRARFKIERDRFYKDKEASLENITLLSDSIASEITKRILAIEVKGIQSRNDT